MSTHKRVHVSKLLLTGYGLSLLIGMIYGFFRYRSDTPHAILHDPAQNAISAHVIVALVIIAGIVYTYFWSRRHTSQMSADGWPTGPTGLWKMPFTAYTARAMAYTFTVIPLALIAFPLSLVGGGGIVNAIDRWLVRKILGQDGQDKNHSYFTNIGMSLWRYVSTLLLAAITILFFFMFWRSGLQVFNMLDPSRVTNAWGGPTPIGASVAHWMDGVPMLYAGVLIMRWLVRVQSRFVLSNPHV